MNWVDYVILAIISISALISLMRGFVREVVSILVWIAAFTLAILFARPMAGQLSGYIDSPTLQVVTAFAVIFIATLLIGALVNYLAGQLVGRTGLTGTDRALGVVFGAGRGLLIVAALILALGLTSAPREGWWQASVVVGYLQPAMCRLGVSEWLDGLMVYAPVAQGEAAGRPAHDYWRGFCASAPASG